MKTSAGFPVGRHALFWCGVLLSFLVLVRVLGSVLTPFVAGAGIAYVLNPVCNTLVRRGLSRSQAALAVLGVFVGVMVVAVIIVGPLLASQMMHFADQLPGYLDQVRAGIEPRLSHFLNTLSEADYLRMREVSAQYAGRAAGVVADLLGGIWQGGAALVGVVSLLLVVPVVAYYLLRDWPELLDRIDSWLPRAHAVTIRAEVRKVDRTLAGFLRGQATVCLTLGVYYALALTVLGLNFGLFIGLMTGLLGFIPFVGSTLGLVLSVILALLQFDTFTPVAVVVGIFALAQFTEGNFLTPKLVGGSVGLHPVWIIFALMAGGSLFGFVGLLLAVPVAAVLGVLIRFVLARYLESSYYTGRVRPARRVRPL